MNNANHTPKVLVVDDSSLITTQIASLLERMHLDFDLAASASQALGLLNNNQYAVVVLDINLPDKNGIELSLALRTRPDFYSKILVITAVSDAFAIERAFLAGADDFMRKPIDGLEFTARTQQLVREYHHSTEHLQTREPSKDTRIDDFIKYIAEMKAELTHERETNERLVEMLSSNVMHRSDLVQLNAKMVKQLVDLKSRNNTLLSEIAEKHTKNG